MSKNRLLYSLAFKQLADLFCDEVWRSYKTHAVIRASALGEVT